MYDKRRADDYIEIWYGQKR